MRHRKVACAVKYGKCSLSVELPFQPANLAFCIYVVNREPDTAVPIRLPATAKLLLLGRRSHSRFPQRLFRPPPLPFTWWVPAIPLAFWILFVFSGSFHLTQSSTFSGGSENGQPSSGPLELRQRLPRASGPAGPRLHAPRFQGRHLQHPHRHLRGRPRRLGLGSSGVGLG